MFKILILTLVFTIVFTIAFWYYEKCTLAGFKKAFKYIVVPCLIAGGVMSFIVQFF